jgi:hypothetical protein
VRGQARLPQQQTRLPKVRTRQARLFCYCHSTRTRTTTPPSSNRCCAASPHAMPGHAMEPTTAVWHSFTFTWLVDMATLVVSSRLASPPGCSSPCSPLHGCGLHGASLGAEALPFVLSWRVSSLVRLHAEAHGLPFVGRIHQKRPLTLSFIARLADVLPRAPKLPLSTPRRPHTLARPSNHMLQPV